MNGLALTRVRVLRGYAAHARFSAELGDAPLGSIPRQPIPSPYAYGPTHVVWGWERTAPATPVIIVETAHRRYEVFRVAGALGPVDA